MNKLADLASEFFTGGKRLKQREQEAAEYRQRKEAADEQEVAGAAQLLVDQQIVVNGLISIRENRYFARLSYDQAKPVTPHKYKTSIGATVFPELQPNGLSGTDDKINFDIADDHSFLSIESCSGNGNQTYRYVHNQERAFLELDGNRFPLLHPRSQTGLEQFERAKRVILGVASLVTRQAVTIG